MHILRSLGPAAPHASATEAVRGGIGALVGLLLTGLFVLSPQVDLSLGLFLVAPFGATSVLVFAVPNSPLAQPWPAIVGNTLAALIGIAVCKLVADPTLRIALAVGLAITVTTLARALHPPAGAVAMTAALSPETVENLGFLFALTPVAAGTTVLIVIAALYARLTGRRYPLRRFDDPSKHGTADRNPSERLNLSEAELTALLERYRQSFNLGVEDLARLIGAAELQAAARTTGPLTTGDIMSVNLITAAPDLHMTRVAEIFCQHRFTSLPVVGADGAFLGIIFQIHLIHHASRDARRKARGFRSSFRRLLDRHRDAPLRAGDIMDSTVPRAGVDTPIGALLPLMADGDVDAVPVLSDQRLVGIVTRTDLVAAMARETARRQGDPEPWREGRAL